MDQETFNLSIRKFLKMVGVNSQREIEQAVAHFATSGEIGDRIHPHLHVELGHCAAAPHDAYLCPVARTPAHDDLVDEAAQQRLPMLSPRGRVCPEFREPITKSYNLRSQAWIDADRLEQRRC